MNKPVMRMKGGGDTNTYSEVEQTTTSLPKYAEPYVKDLLARTGYETAKGYEPYTGQRTAGFSPMEQEAMARYGELGMAGTSPEMKAAGRMAYDAGQSYDHGIGPMRDFQSYIPGDMGDVGQYDPMSRGSEYTAGQRDSGYSADQRDSGYSAGQRDSGYSAGQRDSGYSAGQRDSGYSAGQRDSGYSAGQRDSGFKAGNMYGEALDPYQDQYMQDVVDIEKREASRQGDMRNAATGLDAAGMGGLGGYREAIMRAEAERNLMQQTGDIQTKGSQQAFLNAQQAFEADRQARAQQEQFGQSQFGMNEAARQAQEQFGQSQFGMNESARQAQEQFGQSQFGMNESARQAQERFGQSQFGMNESARQAQEQFGQSQFGMNESARQAQERFGQSQFGMNESARQAQERFGQSQFGMNESARQAQEQFGQSQFGMNEAMRQAQEQFGQSQFGMNETNRQAQEQFGQSAFGMNEGARQQQEAMAQGQFGLNAAENQFGAQMGLDAYNARENAMQQATAFGLTAAEIQQAGEVAAANAMNQQRQTQLGASGMLGDFAGQRQQMELERLDAMDQAGQKQRGQTQTGLDTAYEDFLRQQGWGKEQLAFYNDMLQGNQIKPGETTASYGRQPSSAQQWMGAGIGGLGLYNAMSGNGYSGG